MAAPTQTADAQRRALLARLLEQQSKQDTFPLSYAQKRLWFLAQLLPDNPVYNVPLGFQLDGPLDVSALAESLNEIVRRHEVLRTVFRQVDGDVRQVVRPASADALELPVVDLTDSPEDAQRYRDEVACTDFDLQEGPLIRPLLLRLAPDRHQLCLTLHHIVFDGWSVGILLREIGSLYDAFSSGQASPLPDLPIQYADYAHWQQEHLQEERLEALLDYWRGQLAGASSEGALRGDHRLGDDGQGAVRTYRGDVRHFRLPASVVEPLEALGRRHGATLYMTLLAAFSALLDRYTENSELVLGTLIANRQRAEIEPLIGFFTNTLVLRLDLSGSPDFEQLVQRVKDVAHQAYAHQDLPFELLVDTLEPDRDLTRNPLFQVLFSYREGEETELRLPGLDVTLLPGRTDTAKFDLTCSLSHIGDGVEGRLEFSTELFDASTVENLLGQFETLLGELVASPNRPLAELEVLTAQQQTLLFETWNDSAVPVSGGRRLDELLAAQVAQTPDAVALVHGEETLTYRQLLERSHRLAHRLREASVGPETPVGICLPRGVDLVAGLWAILQADGAYLPLDPDYPAERLRFILQDANAPVVVTLRHLAPQVDGDDRTVICLDELPESPAGEEVTAPQRLGDDHNAAYVIYTSGSTGRPKGVMVTHRNAVNFLTAMDPVARLDHGPSKGEASEDGPGTWLAVTSVSFDISVLELLYTLTRGFRVVLQDDLATLAERQKVASEAVARHMGFSLFYFGGDPRTSGEDRYRLLLEGARFADRHGFEAVWTPERHFHEFGGLFPNPAITGAAVAAVTEHVKIRAGSVVVPLHDPVRLAENWSVIDNISRGRAGISLAPGWHANDFVLAPENFEERKKIMLENAELIRSLWRGEKVKRTSGVGSEVEVGIVPLPVQDEIPMWLTSARNPETFRLAGEMGAGILTHLLGHDIDEVADKIALYRSAWKEHQPSGEGHVTLMLHTFVGSDRESARSLARGPLKEYLSTSFGLIQSLGVTSGKGDDFASLPPEELDALVDRAVDRFADSAALLGDPKSCADMIDRLKAIGVDEVGCLIDFGVEVQDVLDSLQHLDSVRRISEARRRRALRDDSVAAQMQRHGITHLQCTPSLAQLLLAESETLDSLRPLRRLLLGGEALPRPLARQLAEAIDGSLHNMYGPTETTIWSSTLDVSQELASHAQEDGAVARRAASGRAASGQPMAIGRPVANNRLLVMDRRFRPVPPGVIGELWIGGDGVARGYRGRPSLTAERFVPDAWSEVSGARLYRTGDLVRHRPDGVLEFHGRVDQQVKIRGHRIELGEIEARLSDQLEVAEAAVVVRGGAGGDATLVAYCVPAEVEPSADLTETLRGRLGQSLPDAMVPSMFVFPQSLPRTPNGKLDRKALPDPEAAGAAAPRHRPFAPPESELEQQVAAIWQDVLGIDGVGSDDNFFEIGGNSFLIVQVRSRLAQMLDDPPTLVELFRYPSVRTLAASLEGKETSKEVFEKVEANVDKKRQARRRGRQRAKKARQTSPSN